MQGMDIIYTDVRFTSRAFDYENLRKLKAGYDLAIATKPDVTFTFINLRAFPFGGTISYLVAPASINKVRALVHHELKAGPSLPIDLLYQREIHAGRLSAGCIFPFITSVNYDHSSASTIKKPTQPSAEGRERRSPAERLARRMGRYLFFVECDLSAASASLAPLTAQRADDRHLNLLADIQRVLISP
jgi:hypothetical protein